MLDRIFLAHNVQAGAYLVSIASHLSWQYIIVDDLIPCNADGIPLFAFNTDRSVLWAAILEKAYAKFHRCYENIDGGVEKYAMMDLTASSIREFDLSDPDDKEMAASGSLWNILRDSPLTESLVMLRACNPSAKENSQSSSDLAESVTLNQCVSTKVGLLEEALRIRAKKTMKRGISRSQMQMLPKSQRSLGAGLNAGGVEEARSPSPDPDLPPSISRTNTLDCRGSKSPLSMDDEDEGVITGNVPTGSGLSWGCYYTISKFFELEGGTLKLVQIVSPHGNDAWTGRWSENHPCWREHPQAAQACGDIFNIKDGSFFMEYSDLIKHFDLFAILSNPELPDWHQTTLWGMLDFGLFDGDDLCGGEDNWPTNPQYLLTITELTRVIITMSQPNTKIYEGEDEYFAAIGLRVCASTRPGEAYIASKAASGTFGQARAQEERSVTLDLLLEPRDMPYVIVVYTKEPRLVLPYSLTVRANKEFAIEDPVRRGTFMTHLELGNVSGNYSDLCEEWHFEGREHLMVGIDEPEHAPVMMKNRRGVERIIASVNQAHSQAQAQHIDGVWTPVIGRSKKARLYINAPSSMYKEGRYLYSWNDLLTRRMSIQAYSTGQVQRHRRFVGEKKHCDRHIISQHICKNGICCEFPAKGSWSQIAVTDSVTGIRRLIPESAQKMGASMVPQPTLASLQNDFLAAVAGLNVEYIRAIERKLAPWEVKRVLRDSSVVANFNTGASSELPSSTTSSSLNSPRDGPASVVRKKKTNSVLKIDTATMAPVMVTSGQDATTPDGNEGTDSPALSTDLQEWVKVKSFEDLFNNIGCNLLELRVTMKVPFPPVSFEVIKREPLAASFSWHIPPDNGYTVVKYRMELVIANKEREKIVVDVPDVPEGCEHIEVAISGMLPGRFEITLFNNFSII